MNIPSNLCGNPVYVKALYYGNPNKGKSSTEKISFDPDYYFDALSDFLKKNELQRTFYIQQEIKIKSIIWKDWMGMILLDNLHRLLVKKGRIKVSATGLNNKIINYSFKFNGQESSVRLSTTVFNNLATFIFEVPDEYIEDNKKKVKIELIITKDNEWDVKSAFAKWKSFLSKEVIFNDFYPLFTQEDAAVVLEPVVISAIQVNDNNFKPCKFTYVKLVTISEEPTILNKLFREVKNQLGEYFEIESLKEPEEEEKSENEVVVFNELYSRTTLDKEKVMYPIIAGKSKNIELVLSVDNFDIDKCKIHKYEVIHDNKKIELKKTSGKNYEYRHSVNYPYPEMFVPFHCIWPTLAGKKIDLLLHSCRHSNVAVKEVVYPDIKWSFGFHIGAERKKKTKKIQMDCGFSFAAAWDNENKDFSFAVKYPFQDVKKETLQTIKGKAASEIKEMAIDFIDPIVNGKFKYLVSAISNLLRFLGNFLDAKEDMDNYYIDKKKFMKGLLARKTVDPEIKFPNFSFAASWIATTHHREIGVKLAAALKGMLIGLKVTIDLYACMEKIPQIKAFIIGIRWLLENFLNIETKFEIVFDSEINAGSDMSYNTASRKGKAEVYVGGKLDVSITLQASQETSRSATIETVTYGADGETGIFVKLYFRRFAANEEEDTPEEGIYGDLKAGMKEMECGIFKQEVTKKKGKGEIVRTGERKIKNKKYLFGGKKKLLDKIDFTPGDRDFYRFFIR